MNFSLIQILIVILGFVIIIIITNMNSNYTNTNNKSKVNWYSTKGLHSNFKGIALQSSINITNRILISLIIAISGFCLKSIITAGLITLNQLLILSIYTGLCAIPLKILALTLYGKQIEFNLTNYISIFFIGFSLPLLFYGLGIKALVASILWGLLDFLCEILSIANLFCKALSYIDSNHYITGKDFKKIPLSKKDLLFYSEKGKGKDLSPGAIGNLTEPTGISVPTTSSTGAVPPLADSELHTGVTPASQMGESSLISRDSTAKAISDLLGVPVESLIQEKDSLSTSHYILSESTPGKPLHLIIKDKHDLSLIIKCTAKNPFSKQFGFSTNNLFNSVELRQSITLRVIDINKYISENNLQRTEAPLASAQNKRRLSADDIYEDPYNGESSKRNK